ncbi:MAG TPA: hypothetical protein VIW23_16120 [Candidatus Acidoferrum sp.]|jgi:hypothetical protein
MIFGMSAFISVHVLISLIGILSGAAVLLGILGGKRLDGWTVVFLSSTVLTSATGYLLPAHKIMPSHVIGAISLVILAIAIVARSSKHLAGAWRRIYVVTAMIAFYLNVFVLVFQLFTKVPALKAAAPTQSEPPFLIAQLTLLIAFIVLTVLAAKRFRAEPAGA